MAYDEHDSQRMIEQGLASVDPEAWLNSAEFHAAVTVLAQILVPMVKGLAADARTMGRGRDEQIRRLMSGTPTNDEGRRSHAGPVTN